MHPRVLCPLRSLLSLVLALAPACTPGGEGDTPDAAGPEDAGSEDAGSQDAGGNDAGQPGEDAGGPDIDAGSPDVDAGSPDIDAGSPDVDAGGPDIDAGSPDVDAGGPDIDAGSPDVDAGEPGSTYPYEAAATWYDYPGDGACSFGPTPSWPYLVALPEWAHDPSLCGVFVEITSRNATSPAGGTQCSKETTVVAMVADYCPEHVNDVWCIPAETFRFDLESATFDVLGDPSCGILEGLEWRFVERPGDEPIRILSHGSSNPWWFSFVVDRHRYGVVKAEVRDAASDTWHEAERQAWGTFVLQPATGLQAPLDIRLTDLHGQVIVLEDVVTAIQGGVFESSSQFPAGLGGGSPLPLLP